MHECCELYWTSPGGNSPQNSSCTATYHPSRKVRRTRHAGHCWRRKDELISNILLQIPSLGQAKAEELAKTYVQQLCQGSGCSLEDLPGLMNDRERCWERVRKIRASSTTWWWWWLIWLQTKPSQNKTNHIYLIYMYKEDLALDNQQWLICHKTKQNQTFIIQWEYLRCFLF